ncbi:MAG: hypothetical protein WC850_01510 [Candidatus Gracilibacteria bacterium]
MSDTMSDTKYLVLALNDESSKLGNNTAQIALGLRKMYRKDSKFKESLDDFLLNFNGKSEDNITIDDIVDLKFGRKMPSKKVELIKQFLEETLNKFNIGISFESGAFIGIEGCITDVKNSVMNFTGPVNDAESFFSFVKVIRDFLMELKGKVDSILNDEKFREVLSFLLSNLCQKGQKEILQRVCENIKGQEEYKKLVYKKNGGEKTDTSILINFITGDNKELKTRVTQLLFLMFSETNKTQKLQEQYLDSFINHLIRDKALLDGIVDNDTWDLSLDIQDEFEGKRGKVKEDKEIKETKNELGAKKVIINKIHNLTINQQIWFFSNFCNGLKQTFGYAWVLLKGYENNKILSEFLREGNQEFLKLFESKKTKIGKPIIGKFVKKVCEDEKLYEIVGTMLGLDKELFISASIKSIKKKNVFSELEEKERRKILIIKSRIESGFLGLSAEDQRNFLLKIYKKITNEDILITSSKEMDKIKEVINNFIKSTAEYIFGLFFLKDNKIKSKKYIEKLALGLCESKDYSDYCVQFFGLEEEIKNIDEKNLDVKVSTPTNTKALDWVQKDTGPRDLGKILALASDKEDSFDGDADGENPEEIEKSEKLLPVNNTLNSVENIGLSNYLNGLKPSEQREFLIKLCNEAGKIDNLQIMMGRGKTFSSQLKNLFLDGLDLSEIKRKRLNMNLYFLLNKGKDWKLQEETIDFISRFLSKNEILSDAIGIVDEKRKDNEFDNKEEIAEPKVLSDELIIEGQTSELEPTIPGGENEEIKEIIEEPIVSEQELDGAIRAEEVIPKVDITLEQEIPDELEDNGLNKIVLPGSKVSEKPDANKIRGPKKEADIRGFLREKLPDFDKMGETIIPKSGERGEVISTYSSMALNIKPSTFLKLSDFLIVINEIIIEKLRENHPKIKSENYKDYEILDGHFNTVLSGTDGCIIQNMFSNLQEGIKKHDRWKNITQIISLEELDSELSIYINKNKINNTKNI